MDSSDARSGTPLLLQAPAPSLEIGIPSDWNDNGKSPGRLIGEIDLAATPAAVRLARSYVRELIRQHFGADRSELGDLELLTSEAMTNAVLHARPDRNGNVTLSVLHIDRYVRVEITAGGTGPGPLTGVAEPPPVHGRGLMLMKALTTDFGTFRSRNGTTAFWFGIGLKDGWRLP